MLLLSRFRPHLARWERNLWAIVAAEILALLAFGASNVLIPYYIQQLGITDPKAVGAWTGAYQSAGGISFAIFTPIWGAVGDRYGRRLMLLRAMAATAIILAIMGLARNPTQLLLLRLIQGCVTGTPAAASALVATDAPKERLAYSLGLLQTSVWVGASLGPMVGGYVGDAFGYRSTFFASSLVLLVALGLVISLVREPEGSAARAAQARRQSALRSFRELLGSRFLLLLIGLAMAVNLVSSLVSPVLPVFIQELVADKGRLASTAGTISGLSALSAAISALVVGRLADRIGHVRVLLVCALGMTLLYLPEALAPVALVLGAALAAQGLFRGGIGPSLNAMVVGYAPEDKIGAALGLTNSAFSVGFAVGPLLGAGLLALTSTRAVYLLAGALSAVVTLGLLLGQRLMASRALDHVDPTREAA
ncbi:MAG: MFS transporter [Anaerolineae bacterium]|nr:MFS transporter [Anaerolineae bacterium]